jgi:hypothetical protein
VGGTAAQARTGPLECPGALPSGEFSQIFQGACLLVRGMILTIFEKLAGYLFNLRYCAWPKGEAEVSKVTVSVKQIL